MTVEATTDPDLQSWVPVPDGSDFPLQNLPYGIFSRGGEPPRAGVAIGAQVLDLGTLAAEGLFDTDVPHASVLFGAGSLNAFLASGRETWEAARRRISSLLATDNDELRAVGGLVERTLVPAASVTLHLPFTSGDYVDFYSSREHATNLGRMFRPDSEPLLPNWRHLPVGYHGRSSTIVPSGTPVRRPQGQTKPGEDGQPGFGPSRRLDFELEVGFVTGPGNTLGTQIAADDAGKHIFGMVLVNDWSARDIQAWEYQPLGPFLGKSFATSISPWVVPMEALAPYRMPQPPQDPEPLPYLRTGEDWGLDLHLEAQLAADGGVPTVISSTNFSGMYWTPAQQLAHATVNGTAVRPGDLYASGTVSGSEPGTYGSMIELSWGGQQPVELDDGAQRSFLEDGDTVVLRGWCGGSDGRPRVGFGEVRGTILPAA